VIVTDLNVPNTASSLTVSYSATSAASAPLDGGSVIVSVTENCFVVRGRTPVATTSCLRLIAGRHYRLCGIQAGERLAFVAMGLSTGTAYITPGA